MAIDVLPDGERVNSSQRWKPTAFISTVNLLDPHMEIHLQQNQYRLKRVQNVHCKGCKLFCGLSIACRWVSGEAASEQFSLSLWAVQSAVLSTCSPQPIKEPAALFHYRL